MLSEVSAVVFIPLTQGKVAVIDFEDFEKVRPYKWCVARRKHLYYAQSRINGKVVLLHAFLFNPPPGMEVDHKDGNGLNNTRYNARICTHAQNQQARRRVRPGSSSKFRGVSFDSQTGHWRVQIRTSKKQFCLGRFSSEEIAARAYDKKARELFGEFADINFPI